MLIAIFVICVILGLIITAVILMSKDDDGLRVKGVCIIKKMARI